MLGRNMDTDLCGRKNRTAEDQDCAKLSHVRNLHHLSRAQRLSRTPRGLSASVTPTQNAPEIVRVKLAGYTPAIKQHGIEMV
jgi:hypothetical protein